MEFQCFVFPYLSALVEEKSMENYASTPLNSIEDSPFRWRARENQPNFNK